MNKKSFTLMEIAVVITIIGVIAAFAMPGYNRAIQKTRERDAATQLATIHATNSLYKAQAGEYLPTGGLGDLAFINAGLSLSIFANGLIYSYNDLSSTTFNAFAESQNSGGGTVFEIRVDESPLSATNPCCSAGTCLLYPAC